MRPRRLTKGDVLFKKDDRATEMYLTLSGSIRLVEIGVTVGAGSVLGEIGVFGPTRERMDTAVCETDAEVGAIDNEKVLELYHQNPTFGRYLITLVIKRLLDDYVKWREMWLTLGSGPASETLAGGGAGGRV
jgi:CRP-like cAMP-binding protein